MTEIEQFARSVGQYVMKAFVKPWGKDIVRYYRAVVVTPAADGVIVVRKPYDTQTLSLPYTAAAANLAAGEECLVLVLGDDSNAVVFSDGKLQNIGSGGGGGTTVTTGGTNTTFTTT